MIASRPPGLAFGPLGLWFVDQMPDADAGTGAKNREVATKALTAIEFVRKIGDTNVTTVPLRRRPW